MDYRIFGEVDNNHLKGRVRFGPEKTVVVGHSESASHFSSPAQVYWRLPLIGRRIVGRWMSAGTEWWSAPIPRLPKWELDSSKGGNAVDAAVAIQFALNVVEPMMSGIGGGGFMMVYDQKSKKITIVDSRERPSSATPDMFLGEDGKPVPLPRHTRGNAVGVPGTLKGLDTALKRWGNMPLSDLILLWYNMN